MRSDGRAQTQPAGAVHEVQCDSPGSSTARFRCSTPRDRAGQHFQCAGATAPLRFSSRWPGCRRQKRRCLTPFSSVECCIGAAVTFLCCGLLCLEFSDAAPRAVLALLASRRCAGTRLYRPRHGRLRLAFSSACCSRPAAPRAACVCGRSNTAQLPSRPLSPARHSPASAAAPQTLAELPPPLPTATARRVCSSQLTDGARPAGHNRAAARHAALRQDHTAGSGALQPLRLDGRV